ncbi:unnamed protein product [Ixodes pacificus]
MGTYGGGFVLGDKLNIGQNHLVIRRCKMFPLLLACVLVALCTDACPTPEIPKNGKSVLRIPKKALPTQTSSYPTGTTVVYTCDADFDLMGPQHRRCHDDGLWHPEACPSASPTSLAVFLLSSPRHPTSAARPPSQWMATRAPVPQPKLRTRPGSLWTYRMSFPSPWSS